MNDLDWIRMMEVSEGIDEEMELSEGSDEETDSIVAPSEVSFFSDDGEEDLIDIESGVIVARQKAMSHPDDNTIMSHATSSTDNNSLSLVNVVCSKQCQLELPPQQLLQPFPPQQLLQPPPPQLIQPPPPQLIQPPPPQLLQPPSQQLLQPPPPQLLQPPPEQPPESLSQCIPQTCGFSIVGDNIDKNFRPSYQRQDRQTKSLHYFHAYAAKNCVDISAMSDGKPAANLTFDSFLPTQSDLDKLLSDFEILTSR